MKITLFGAAASLALFAATAWAQNPPIADADFVMKASVGNTFEVQEAQLAVDHATDPRLKSFAQHMIADHGNAEKELQAAAPKAGAKVEMMLDQPHQAMLDNLKSFSGTDFDKIYIADQVAAHAETVLLLSDYIQSGGNASLKSWTNKTLPVVKMHRAMIDAM